MVHAGFRFTGKKGLDLERGMNRRVLLWLIAIVLLATVGCRPRHPPHTPQPLNMTGVDERFRYGPAIQRKSPLTDNHAPHYYRRP
jgi:hypothetical protein